MENTAMKDAITDAGLSPRRGKTTVYRRDIERYMLDHRTVSLSSKKIARDLKAPVANIEHHLSKLKIEGLIRKRGYALKARFQALEHFTEVTPRRYRWKSNAPVEIVSTEEAKVTSETPTPRMHKRGIEDQMKDLVALASMLQQRAAQIVDEYEDIKRKLETLL